jgi:class 3 adenylate cyclase
MTIVSAPTDRGPLDPVYLNALTATGLVDGISDIEALHAKPFRYAEGQFLCRHGDMADQLWVIVTGSVAIKENEHTLFVRSTGRVVGEQHIMGNGHRRMFDLQAIESNVEVLAIAQDSIENHPEAKTLWRNIARIDSLKLRAASEKIASLSRQLEDDTRILQAYTNEYALRRRYESGGLHRSDYQVDRAIVWFSDVADFSRFAANLPPDRTAEIVENFFNAQSAPIAARGGYIDKFIGDGLMAFWVVPAETEDCAEACLNCLKAAEEAQREVAQIKVGTEALGLRIGLHVGLVLSGDFGSTVRHQFTLIGPEVNKASRLEELHADDVLEGSPNLGDIRMSGEFFNQLSPSARGRYPNVSKAVAKNIGEITVHS